MLNFLTEVAYFFSVIIRVLYPIYAISSLPYGDNLTFQPHIMDWILFWTVVSAIGAILALLYMILQDILPSYERRKLITRVFRQTPWILGGVFVGAILLETKNVNLSIRMGAFWGTIVGGIYGIINVTVIAPLTLILYRPTLADIFMSTGLFAIAGLVAGTITGVTIWAIENTYFNPAVDLVQATNQLILRISVAAMIWIGCLLMVRMIVRMIDKNEIGY